MSDPSDRPGVFLPGMSWFSEVEAEGRLISRKWKAWWQASKVKNRKAPSPLGLSPETERGFSRSASASWPELPGSYPSVLLRIRPRQHAGPDRREYLPAGIRRGRNLP